MSSTPSSGRSFAFARRTCTSANQSTLSAEDQARLLGDAWERADKPEALDVRLVIYHRSGRADTYHLGAHPPSLTSGDLDLIHRLWLDAVKTVGPHVHHDDVVRAALKQMEQQLTGPQRDDGDRGDSRRGASGRRTRGGASRSRLRTVARHAPQPPRRRHRIAPDGAQHRRPGGRLPGDAAEGCRGGVRVPLAGVEGSAAEGDGAGRRRGAAEQHGSGRSHAVPRGAARRSHSPAAGAAHAGGTRRGA